jgi:hypothetical protein
MIYRRNSGTYRKMKEVTTSCPAERRITLAYQVILHRVCHSVGVYGYRVTSVNKQSVANGGCRA